MNTPAAVLPFVNITEQLSRSLVAQGIESACGVAWAIERGSVRDVVDTYKRLLTRLGRSMSDAPALRDATTQTHYIFPLAMVKLQDRLLMLQQFILPALRNCQALDAERHWRIADALVKGWCLAQANFYRVQNEYIDTHPAIEVEDQHADALVTWANHENVREFEALGNGDGW